MLQGELTTSGALSHLSEAQSTNLKPNPARSQSSPYKETKIGGINNDENMENQSPPSSPFNADVTGVQDDTENNTITKSRITAKSPIDREQTSPLKMLKSRASPQKDGDTVRSPRKISAPEKRFPVKPASPEPNRPAPIELSIDDVLRDNEGLTKAIQILEDEDSLTEDPTLNDTLTSMRGDGVDADETMGVDDTFVSTYSTFSAVPDMTTFARVGQTPSRLAPTPRRTIIETPATQRRPTSRLSPTSRAHTYTSSRDSNNTTSLLLDFTDQMSGFNGYAQPSPSRTGRNSPMKSISDMSWDATPTANRNTMSNLLDFDIPPAPTPRSMPSVTPRELESLKSQFLSEISSLKASLSGKEAEVQSLKSAVGDAEKRVGESMEQVREERNHREQLVIEKEDWEKRGREMEAVLRNVKEEIVHGERERDELEGRLEEAEGRRQAAEMMAQETERKLATLRGGKTSSLSESTDSTRTSPPGGECVDCGGSKAVEVAVEKVSRDLHALYKEKHETKVAALKKSYEKRWEKKIRELEDHIEELRQENEELKRDLTMTKLELRVPVEPTINIEAQAANEARSKELEAEIDGLNETINSVKFDNSELRKLLETERVENSKLVQAVDEMIPLVAAFDDMLSNTKSAPENTTTAPPTPRSTPLSPKPQRPQSTSNMESLRGSISRASGLRAPTSVKTSRIAGPSSLGHDRTKSIQRTGLERPGMERPSSGLGYSSGRSGIMNSIEKMGSYKGRGEQ